MIDNVYGPTEATIECLWQRFEDPPATTPERGAIALGRPYPGVQAAVLSADLRPLGAGEIGELAISGSQLAVGYLGNPELTERRFPVIDGVRWYLTGDKTYQDGDGRFHHLGRLDEQVKIRGYRVELGEIEMRLRQAPGVAEAAALGWPVVDGAAVEVAAFCTSRPDGPEIVVEALRAALRQALPAYMVPSRIRILDALPLNAHGKIDRRQLVAALEAEAGGSSGRAPSQDRTSDGLPRK